MKRILFSGLFLFSSICSFAQWDSLQAGVANNPSTSPGSATVYTMLSSGKELCVGGKFDTVNGQPASGIASWNGTSWNVFGSITTNGLVLAMTKYNGNLIVGGDFNSINGKLSSNVVLWNDTTWSSLGTSTSLAYVEAMTVYNGNLYIGGISTTYINMWNGTSWVPPIKSMKSNNKTNQTGVFAMQVWNGKLYVSGYFDSINGKYIRNLAMWNDTTWSAVNNAMPDSVIGSLAVFNNKLYVGGFITQAKTNATIGMISQWDGTIWSTIGTTNYGAIYAIAAYGTNLYAAGAFDTINGKQANSIAYWDGANWYPADAGVYGTIYSLATFGTMLYAGGRFNNAGGFSVNSIARYQAPNSINELSQTNSVKVYPNPSNGQFNFEIRNYELGVKSKVEVYNMMGEKVLSQFTTNNSPFTINISNQPTGIYLYRLIDNTGVAIATGKLMVE